MKPHLLPIPSDASLTVLRKRLVKAEQALARAYDARSAAITYHDDLMQTVHNIQWMIAGAERRR